MPSGAGLALVYMIQTDEEEARASREVRTGLHTENRNSDSQT